MELDRILLPMLRKPALLTVGICALILGPTPIFFLVMDGAGQWTLLGLAGVAAVLALVGFVMRPRAHRVWRALHGGPDALQKVQLYAASNSASHDWTVVFTVEGDVYQSYRLPRSEEPAFLSGLRDRVPPVRVEVTPLVGQTYLATK
jgi:hypothetical protein